MAKNSHIAGGIHAVRAALKHGSANVLNLWLDNSRKDRRIQDVESLAQQMGVTINRVRREQLDQLFKDKTNHQGVAVEVMLASAKDEHALYRLLDHLDETVLLLILDGVTDPHNLGACLRSADAAGVHAVIAPKDNSVGLTPVVTKVASGAAETVTYVQVTNLARTMEKLKQDYNIWLYGAAGETQQSLFETDLRQSVGIVMGAEGKGLRRLTREHCDALIRIPMKGQVESLNVSVATGVCLFEVLRQRSQ